MATIIECDGGCGARSPDKRGLFVANHWATVRISGPRDDIERRPACDDKRYCEKCWSRVSAALQSKDTQDD